MPHANAITSILEAAVRLAALQFYAAAAAADAVTSNRGGTVGAEAEAVAAEACCLLSEYGSICLQLCYYEVSGSYPHRPAPLAMLALAAGPGSQAQHRLYSLLATMFKLSHWQDSTGRSLPSQWEYCAATAAAASALLADAAERQQDKQQQPGGAGAAGGPTSDNSSHTPADVALPLAFLLGRCCLQLAEQLPAASCPEPQQEHRSSEQQPQQQPLHAAQEQHQPEYALPFQLELEACRAG
jgi:hypothetical protein